MNTFRIIFKFNYNGQIVEKNIDIGLIQSIKPFYEVTTTTAGIPSQPSQNTFIFDMGVKKTFTFSFLRIQPPVVNDSLDADSTQWSNGFWIYIMKRYVVNRWQAETDGCKIVYTVPEENQDYYPPIPVTNVYVSEFTPKQTAGDTMTISGGISFVVGATNISKIVAKHTIIYDANFKAYSPSSQDDTNYVTVTNDDSTNAVDLPAIWQSRAYSIYGITMGTFRWATDPIPNQDTVFYEQKEYISDLPETLELYAIYDTAHPPTGGV